MAKKKAMKLAVRYILLHYAKPGRSAYDVVRDPVFVIDLPGLVIPNAKPGRSARAVLLDPVYVIDLPGLVIPNCEEGAKRLVVKVMVIL